MKTMKIAIAATAMACVALACAGSASADPLLGNYTGTMIDGGKDYDAGQSAPFTMNPCGPDCIRVTQTGSGWELHRQGHRWVGSDAKGTQSLDENTLVLTLDSVRGDHIVIGLTKSA